MESDSPFPAVSRRRRSFEFSSNGQRKLRTMISELPKVRQNVRVEITAVSVSLDDLESDLRLVGVGSCGTTYLRVACRGRTR